MRAAIYVWAHQENHEIPWFLLLLPETWAARCFVFKNFLEREYGFSGAWCLFALVPLKARVNCMFPRLLRRDHTWGEIAQVLLWGLWVDIHCWRKLDGVRLVVLIPLLVLTGIVWLVAWAVHALIF